MKDAEIRYYNTGEIESRKYQYAVIMAAYKGRWIYVRHKDRETWEVPGGHVEEGEDVDTAASRELFEETGAFNFSIEPVCDYSVTSDGTTSLGRLYTSEIAVMGPLPESEIREVKLFKEMPASLTYPNIQPKLHDRAMGHLKLKILLHLEKDMTRNINMINFIKNYPIQTMERIGDSVLVRGKSDEDWVYISSESFSEFKLLTENLDSTDKCFAVLEDWMLNDIIKERRIRSRLTSLKLVYPLASYSMEAVSRDGLQAEPLEINDARQLYESSKYKEYISIAYIEDRIRNGFGYCVRDKGIPVAWALTHDDGAIGFLNVLEEYRRRGYANAVTTAMVRRLLQSGELPFIHIEEDNAASLKLASKSGFRVDRRTHWIKLS